MFAIPTPPPHSLIFSRPGALSCVYWLMRLGIDGENGFSYGVDVDGNWEVITSPKRNAEEDPDEPPSPASAKVSELRMG